MKIAHLSDTHLGYADLSVIGDDGVPLRERDIYDAFDRAIEAIIAARVDAVVHAGDLFHRASPTNRALTHGLAGLKRLTDAGLPVVVLAGNHDAPRTAFTGPILAALESIPGVHPLYRPQVQSVRLGELVVHGVPHLLDVDEFFAAYDALAPVPGALNVLALHASVGAKFMMEEFGEQVIEGVRREKFAAFAYTALGHWHGHRVLSGPGLAAYSGSTEHIGERELDKQKGWMLVDLADPAQPQATFQPLAIRPQYKLIVEDCHAKTDAEILAAIAQQAEPLALDGAMVRLHLAGLDPAQAAGLTNRRLSEPFTAAPATLITRSFVGGASKLEVVELATVSLPNLFADHLEQTLTDPERRARVLALGRKYLAEAER